MKPDTRTTAYSRTFTKTPKPGKDDTNQRNIQEAKDKTNLGSLVEMSMKAGFG